jgi:hypothetical protein
VDNAKDFQEHYHIAKFNDAFGLTKALNPTVEFVNGIQWRKSLRTTKASSTRNKAISHNSPLLSSSSFILDSRETSSGGTDRVTNSTRNDRYILKLLRGE